MAELSKAMQLMSFQILHYKRLDLLSVYRDVLQVIWTNASLLRQSHSWHSHRIKARYSYCDVVERRATFARHNLSLIHISEPTRLLSISYAVFCLKKKKKKKKKTKKRIITKTQKKNKKTNNITK